MRYCGPSRSALRAGQGPDINWAWFAQLDRVRRLQGVALDAFGLGPRETPYRLAHSEAGVALRRYGGDGERGPLVLILPAPIKRPYIWDLAPEVSAVRRCLDAGMRVFLADWQSAPAEFGLADYAERLIAACLDAAGGEPAMLLGHSLGGLFAAMFSTLHPERVRGVVLLAVPLHFGAEAGVFSRMTAALDPDRLPESLPGAFVSMASFNAAPATFGWERWMDGVLSLADSADLRRHLQVERWTLDEFALPRRLVAELVVLIVREDRFARGTLEIGGRIAAPSRLSAPLLGVIDPHCGVVAPETVLPVFKAAASRDKTLLHYKRDVGVSLQHVGPLVSRDAHAALWPQIIQWMQAH
jgi:polyhydroxyalkanoate synthase subunit PhaC